MGEHAALLSRSQCLTRLRSERVGRASVTRRALPAIVPVTYQCDGMYLLLHAPFDLDFGDICDGAVLAFEVGNIDGGAEWTVQVVGLGAVMPDRAVRVDLERMTGRRRRRSLSRE